MLIHIISATGFIFFQCISVSFISISTKCHINTPLVSVYYGSKDLCVKDLVGNNSQALLQELFIPQLTLQNTINTVH